MAEREIPNLIFSLVPLGGIARVLELLRICPCAPPHWSLTGQPEGLSNAEAGFRHLWERLACGSSQPSLLLASAADASAAHGADVDPDNLSRAWFDPVTSLLRVLAAMLREDFNCREEMFQMRGFAVLGRLLHERVRSVGAWYSIVSESDEAPKPLALSAGSENASSSISLERKFVPSVRVAHVIAFLGTLPTTLQHRVLCEVSAWSISHPLNYAVWLGIAEVLAAVRANGNDWGPLFVRSLRFLLCDVLLWTAPLVMTHPPSAASRGAREGPAVAASVSRVAESLAPGYPRRLWPPPDVISPPAEQLSYFLSILWILCACSSACYFGWSAYSVFYRQPISCTLLCAMLWRDGHPGSV